MTKKQIQSLNLNFFFVFACQNMKEKTNHSFLLGLLSLLFLYTIYIKMFDNQRILYFLCWILKGAWHCISSIEFLAANNKKKQKIYWQLSLVVHDSYLFSVMPCVTSSCIYNKAINSKYVCMYVCERRRGKWNEIKMQKSS